MGSHLLLTTLLIISLIPSQTPHLCLPSPRWWDVGQPSPAVNPSKLSSLSEERRMHLSGPDSHLAHPALLTNHGCNSSCACFSELVKHKTEHAICKHVCLDGQFVSCNTVEEREGGRLVLFWEVSMIVNCTGSVSGLRAPLVAKKRMCCSPSQVTGAREKLDAAYYWYLLFFNLSSFHSNS